jgi:hypothetical protein
VFEHFDIYLKNYNNNVSQFSTFRHNAIKHAEIYTNKVPLSEFFPNAPDAHVLPVYRCDSDIKAVQESKATCYSYRFLDHHDHVRFVSFLKMVMIKVNAAYLNERLNSYRIELRFQHLGHSIVHHCPYQSQPEFIEQVLLINQSLLEMDLDTFQLQG